MFRQGNLHVLELTQYCCFTLSRIHRVDDTFCTRILLHQIVVLGPFIRVQLPHCVPQALLGFHSNNQHLLLPVGFVVHD